MNNIKFKLNKDLDGYIVTGFEGRTETSVIIPSVYDNLPVVAIEDKAFSYGSSLTTIEIPKSVILIGVNAFSDCSNLATITVNNNNPYYKSIDGVLYNKDATELIRYPGKKIGSSFTIPRSVTTIGNIAFINCWLLATISIGDNVMTIGNYVFQNCYLLTTIDLPCSVTSIGNNAFSGCSSLTTITVNNNNPYYKSIDGVLYNKDATELIRYPARKTGSSFTIPGSVTSIGNRAFRACKNLTTITIPCSVSSIEYYAFRDCSNLTTVTMPCNVTYIGSWAFIYCKSLTTITIPCSVTSIGNYAFEGCASLTIYCEAASQPKGWRSDWNLLNYWESSILPAVWGHNNITTNSDYDYVIHGDNVSLTRYKGTATDITIPNIIDGKTVIGFGVTFSGKNITTIDLPNSVTTIGSYTFYNCTSLTTITVNCNNPYYKSIDGVLYNKDVTELICYPAGKTATSFTIPSSVTSIGEGAFGFCQNLTSITIPNSVTHIKDSAFYGCASLATVTIGNSVAYIGSSAFSDCSSLTIYCQAECQPTHWMSDWNSSKRPVEWGYSF